MTKGDLLDHTDHKEMKHRILIVDDHPIVRHGMAELICQEEDLEVCGEAGDTAEAMHLVEQCCPEIVIVDISLDGDNGIELIEQIKARYPQTKMLVSSIHDEKVFAGRALRAGAMGYVSKRENVRKIVNAIRRVIRGEIYLSPHMANRLLHCAVIGEPLDRDPIESLSNRELEIFELIGQGLTTQQIAGKLRLSAKTVETHRTKIKMKLNLPNSVQLSRCAFEWVRENR
ncbi:MAG: response regulator transcription factor [Thermoguttaceae bacterium]|jgi:DNA-binding NarL/FixJ family response regulator